MARIAGAPAVGLLHQPRSDPRALHSRPSPDIVRVLKDINLNVVSAEVDTIGKNAFDKFNLTYHVRAAARRGSQCILACCVCAAALARRENEKLLGARSGPRGIS